jgi:transcriptional regulator with XRE-family HTH domain
MDILYNIKKIRQEKGISQEYLANKLNIDVANYSRLESGKHELKISHIAIIAKVLQVREIDIFTYPRIFVDKDTVQHADKVSVTFEISPDNIDLLLQLISKKINGNPSV